MSEITEIGHRIKLFGERKFKSVAELSRKLHYKNRQQIYDYISGKSYPGGELLIKLAKLGCDINWLLLGEEKFIVKERRVDYFGYSEDDINKKLAEHFIGHMNRLENEIKELKEEMFKLRDKASNNSNEKAKVKK